MIKNNQSGQVLVLAIIVAGLVLINILAIISGSQLFFQNTNYANLSAEATNLAEAGIDKALASLNTTGGSYTGEETNLGAGTYSVTITNPNAGTKIIEAVGYIPSKANPKSKKTIIVSASKGEGMSFNYAIQVGEGGMEMSNNSQINGSVYSNGNIIMTNNSKITGDAYVAGGVATNADQESDCASINCTEFIFGKNVGGDNRLDPAQSFIPESSNYLNKVSLKLKKIGLPSDIPVRILANNSGKPDKNNVLANGTLNANLVTGNYNFVDVTFNNSPHLQSDTTYWIMLDTSSNSTNYWSWSVDSLQGYTNGQGKWSPNWQASNPAWNTILADLNFRTYMGGLPTYIQGSNGVNINGSAYANTLTDLNIAKDAYYQSQSGISVNGSNCTNNSHCHPASPDPAPKVMPISDANISAWRTSAIEVGVFTGDISSCRASLGPGKYVGNITFTNGCNVVIKDPVWITGNLLLSNNITLKLDSGYGPVSGVIIVDGIIDLSNTAKIQGSGNQNSLLLAVSTFDSRTNGQDAINVGNGGNFGILYAPYGIADIANGNHLKELTAWKIKLNNNVIVDYDTGLAAPFFSSGPSGSYSLIKGTYQIK